MSESPAAGSVPPPSDPHMAAPRQATPSTSRDQPARLPLALLAGTSILILGVAFGGLAFFFSRGLINIYGDSVAHMEGARRLFDSLTPGYAEIGTVWLPVFHLMVSPLAQSDFLWRTGLGGGLVSAAAFAVTAWFMFRLALEMNRNVAAAAVGLIAVLFCPDMVYLASTPLTESLNLMWFVLAIYGLFRYQVSGRLRPLIGASLAAFFGTLTRYDIWYVLPFAALFVFIVQPGPFKKRFWRAALFSAISGAGPVLWFVHNAIRYGNPLEFYNGPYSAKAIYAHQLATTRFPYPTDGSFFLSARYYLADLMLVIGFWPLALALLGFITWAVERGRRRERLAGLLFLMPLPFYWQAMAHAAVPLYVPTLFPHTYYNLRYGLELLPAVAMLASFAVSSRLSRPSRLGLAALFVALLVFQDASLIRRGATNLAVVREGWLNNPCHSKTEQALIQFFRKQYDGRLIVMTVGEWPCVMPTLDIPFRKTLTEANREPWLALRSGMDSGVGWIVRGAGDSVDRLMQDYPQTFKDFDLIERDKFPGEDGVVIYRRKAR